MDKTIDIGSGGWKRREGILNLDIRPLPNVDIVADARKIPLEDRGLDKIIAREVIEHFSRDEILPLLKEWNRVLRMGGTMEIQTPDGERVLDNWRKMPPGRIWGALYGAQKNKEDLHKMLFTIESIKEYLVRTGFRIDRTKRFVLRDIPRMKILCTKIV
jgi:predicted SAM-dependent methyltransferase